MGCPDVKYSGWARTDSFGDPGVGMMRRILEGLYGM